MSDNKREVAHTTDELPSKLDLWLMEHPATNWHFLINPAAGRGKALRRWRKMLPRLQAALPGMSWAESTAEAGMSALAEATVLAGHTHLVGVGGDGTHHDIVNGIVAAGGLDKVTYAPLPLGSGNDWVRTLNTPRKLEAWLTMLAQGKTIAHGVGVLRYEKTDLEASASEERAVGPDLEASASEERAVGPDLEASASEERAVGPSSVRPANQDAQRSLPGRFEVQATQQRYFLNVAGMAYDAEVLRRAEKSPIKHRFIYPLLTLLFLRDFNAPTVRITHDDKVWEGAVHTINLGIGRYSGGGMRLVPQAEPTAKTLALTFAKRLSVWRILAESWRFYAGSIGQVKGVILTSATKVSIQPLKETLELEADGEWLGIGRVEAELLQQNLTVVIP